jgi:uncharacterized protein YceK
MRRLTLLAPTLALSLTGCGTLWNLCSIDDPNYHHQQAPREVFGGVAFDAKWAIIDLHDSVFPPEPYYWTVTDSIFGLMYGTALVVDMPLSAVADTLTLPITIPEATRRTIPACQPNDPATPASAEPR